MLAALTSEYFCIYNQETFKECFSDWLIKDPWFMACLIPPDFHWVVAWRDGVIYSDFVIVGEQHIFVTYQVQSCIPGISSFYMFISFVTVKWLVHEHCWPLSLKGYCFHIFWGQKATISYTARGEQVLTSHLLSWNARVYLGWSLYCCQSNEGQQLWWQISFDKLNDPQKEKSAALIATGE